MDLVSSDSQCTLCPTRSVCTARDLDEAQLTLLSSKIDTSAVLQKNDHLYRHGDRTDSCYVVRSGVFKNVVVTALGEEYVTGFHYPGELIGFSAKVDGEHPDSAVALTASTACRIAFCEFDGLFSLGAGSALLKLLAEREANDRNLEINLRQSRAEARIAGFFVLLMRRLKRLGYDTTSLPLPMSRTDLANHLGLTLECLSRELGKWKKAGVIATEKSVIRLIMPEELSTLACHLS